mmetsp:Transcript_11972/g.16583  ORF Transcript_11972/g.16583 Transcript_11972/m.16583 type:complete len:80 (-) Transcript_11972:31-270(-)
MMNKHDLLTRMLLKMQCNDLFCILSQFYINLREGDFLHATNKGYKNERGKKFSFSKFVMPLATEMNTLLTISKYGYHNW